jgi:hypothetical protein
VELTPLHPGNHGEWRTTGSSAIVYDMSTGALLERFAEVKAGVGLTASGGRPA